MIYVAVYLGIMTLGLLGVIWTAYRKPERPLTDEDRLDWLENESRPENWEIAPVIPLKPRPKDWFFRIAKRAEYKGRR